MAVLTPRAEDDAGGVLLFRPGNRQRRDGDHSAPSMSRILMLHDDRSSSDKPGDV